MSTLLLIFADGAQIRARICAPVHVYAEGNEYAVTPVIGNDPLLFNFPELNSTVKPFQLR